jgi:putative transposase
MVWQPTRLTRTQQEERRFAAAQLLAERELSEADIAGRVGVSRAAVSQWKQRLASEGVQGLHQHRAPGRPSRLSDTQWEQVLDQLQRGAVAAGFDTERWTLPRIAHLIERRFGVRYWPSAVSQALHARGWSPQRPLPRAAERDEALIAAWLRRDWLRVKRGLAAQGVRLPSWTRRVTRFGPGSAPRGRPPASRPCCHG